MHRRLNRKPADSEFETTGELAMREAAGTGPEAAFSKLRLKSNSVGNHDDRRKSAVFPDRR